MALIKTSALPIGADFQRLFAHSVHSTRSPKFKLMHYPRP
jgi:hypothetical protein